MRISLKDSTITCLSVTICKGIVKIQTDSPQTMYEVVQLLDGTTNITYYNDNDEIMGVIDAGYQLKYIMKTPYDVTYVIEIPYTEPETYDVSSLVEQITNIELALCEIYENMGV